MTVDADQLTALNATRTKYNQPVYVRPVPTHAVQQAAENPKLYGGLVVRSGVLDRRLSGNRLKTEAVD